MAVGRISYFLRGLEDWDQQPPSLPLACACSVTLLIRGGFVAQIALVGLVNLYVYLSVLW